MPASSRIASRPRILALAALLAAGAAACDSTPDARSPADLAGLPVWEGHAREVFDDNIDPAAVGLSMEGVSARGDRYLRERAQTADVVSRVRVQTVTAQSAGEETTYKLVVQVGTPPLRAPRLPDPTFELSVGQASGAYGVARAFDTRLRGLTFIAFLGRFAGPDGEPVIHFHLSADTDEVAKAVKDAVALGELSGS